MANKKNPRKNFSVRVGQIKDESHVVRFKKTKCALKKRAKIILYRANEKTTGTTSTMRLHHECSSIQHENGGLEEQYHILLNKIS